jgi:hypothetical protein
MVPRVPEAGALRRITMHKKIYLIAAAMLPGAGEA